jgi:hypothetical protein
VNLAVADLIGSHKAKSTRRRVLLVLLSWHLAQMTNPTPKTFADVSFVLVG